MLNKKVLLLLILFLFVEVVYSTDNSKNEKKIVIYNVTKELKDVIIKRRDFTEKLNGQANQIYESFLFSITEIPFVKVYERTYLEKIFKEQKLSHSDDFNEQTAIEAGKLVGANILITTNVTIKDINHRGNAIYTLNLKIINIETAQIIKMIKIKNADFDINIEKAVEQISNLKIE